MIWQLAAICLTLNFTANQKELSKQRLHCVHIKQRQKLSIRTQVNVVIKVKYHETSISLILWITERREDGVFCEI